jgi:hypothetical protein
MTPFQLFREAPVRIRTSWPLIWKLLLCSAVSMAVAVSLTAWRADRYYRAKLRRAEHVTLRASDWRFPTRAEIDQRMTVGCRTFVSGPDLLYGTADDRSLAP